MLHQLLREIEASQGPMRLSELARKLEVEPSALEGMITFWVRKGRLKEVSQDSEMVMACSGSPCPGGCPGPSSCPFVAKMPRSFSVAPPKSGGCSRCGS